MTQLDHILRHNPKAATDANLRIKAFLAKHLH